MMQKRSLYSLLLISFIVVFAASMASANNVTFQSRTLARCVATSANVTATVTSDSVSAIEIVVEISGALTLPAPGGIFAFDPAFTKLVNRVVDDTSNADGVMPDTIRIAAIMLNPSDGALAAGTYVVGRINFTTNDVCNGTGDMKGADFEYPIPATITTQFVDAATNAIVPATTTPGTITFVNALPTLAAYANQTLFWGASLAMTSTATDADAANGCEALVFSKQAGPAALTVNPASGAIAWLTTSADIGLHNVTVRVTDKCGAFVEQSFTVCVQNKPPVITCPAAPIVVILGDPVAGSVSAVDPDMGPGSLLFSKVSFNGPNNAGMVVNPATGAFSWPTIPNDNSYVGTWTLKIAVADAAPLSACSPSNADTCDVIIKVEYSKVQIAKTHGTIQGQYEYVPVYLNTQHPIGGFDLLISYDNSALGLQEVIKGDFLTDCGWEYFNYTFGAFGNCNGGCPSGLVHVVAIAEYNNGANHPTCFSTVGTGADSTLFTLKFMVSNDRTLECQYAPVKFFWVDCTDNALSSVTGDTLFISHRVFHYGGDPDLLYEVTDYDAVLPTEYGAPDLCIAPLPNKPQPWRLVDFVSGGVDIVCADSIDARGDINLNNIANEIADAVMFSRYFVYGPSVFTINLAGQTAASDVNADGLVLTVADLVYLVRIITGQALPYYKVDAKNAIYNFHNGLLSVDPTLEFGAAYLVVKGDARPNLRATGMAMEYAYDGTNTRILVYPQLSEGMTEMATFSGDVLDVNGELISLELATADGQPVFAKLIPKAYALDQNYPNPFNPSTTISFALPNAGNYALTIYNINGQVVKTFEGTAEAGYVDVVWNASDAGSGVYFYKLTAGNYSSTKKMVLLK